MQGMVLKIDRASKHDGPGLRTVVFLKGCPLRCVWCSTPDSQSGQPELLHLETLCARCGRCVAACTEGALRLGPEPALPGVREQLAPPGPEPIADQGARPVALQYQQPGAAPDPVPGPEPGLGTESEPARRPQPDPAGPEAQPVRVDRDRCTLCGECLRVCLNNALRVSGTLMSVDEVFAVVERSRGFWTRMPGGLTISGGEPLHQFGFTRSLLRRCHQAGIDTNIETSCLAPMDKVRELLPLLDHVCCDVKHLDDAEHIRLTGVSNRLILDNIRMISRERDLILRFPVIPGCNDGEENIEATADFILGLGERFNRVDLLPYHELGAATYRRLGRDYALQGTAAPGRERMEAIRDRMIARGVRAVVA